MILATQIVVLCTLFSLIIITGTKKNSLGGLHNLPKAIKECVSELPEYNDKNVQIVSAKRRILKKPPVLILFASICLYFCGSAEKAEQSYFL